jgi:hypothetical protein
VEEFAYMDRRDYLDEVKQKLSKLEADRSSARSNVSAGCAKLGLVRNNLDSYRELLWSMRIVMTSELSQRKLAVTITYAPDGNDANSYESCRVVCVVQDDGAVELSSSSLPEDYDTMSYPGRSFNPDSAEAFFQRALDAYLEELPRF